MRRKFRDDDVIRPDEYVDICPNCGGLFNPNPTGRRKKFCSDECRLAWNHKHPHEWLDQFEMFSIYEILPDILELRKLRKLRRGEQNSTELRRTWLRRRHTKHNDLRRRS